MGPLYAHLYRDPAPGDLMKKIAPAVCGWVERMNSESVAVGDFVENDEIPPTLFPILRRMAKEHIPVLLDTDKKLTDWRAQNSDASEVERFIGEHEFEVEGVTGERAVLPYALWMFLSLIHI